jgi:hypothetical protein
LRCTFFKERNRLVGDHYFAAIWLLFCADTDLESGAVLRTTIYKLNKGRNNMDLCIIGDAKAGRRGRRAWGIADSFKSSAVLQVYIW